MTEQLKAYAMYDMGDGFIWNEVAFRDNVLASPNANYNVHPVRIGHSSYDHHRAELNLALEKESGAQYPLKLMDGTTRLSFLNDVNVRRAHELVGKTAIGLFQNNVLMWLIAYSRDVTLDDINQTKVDAGDYSSLTNNQDDQRLDDLLE